MFHRSIEHETTGRILQTIFSDDSRYRHHVALPAGTHFGDEGAANHTRFCNDYGDPGVELFVFGRHAFQANKPHPTKFPARQTFEASRAVAALHQLDPSRTVFAQQNPAVIDAGVFHNDVIAVGDRNLLLYHEQAFLNTQDVLDEIRSKTPDKSIQFVEAPEAAVSVEDAVSSYLFNSQLLRTDNNQTVIVAPLECQNNDRVNAFLNELVAQDNPIQSVKYFDLRESMKNGGGPACLRLRVVMSEQDIQNCQANVFLNDSLHDQLGQWIDKHYRDRLGPDDVRDPNLITEGRTALDELTQLLKLGSIYDFQRTST